MGTGPVQLDERLLSWARDLDDATRRQALRTARLPVLAGPVALMPDAHYGIGATVGSVVVTEHAILPSAVGVDIGCGMIAAETTLRAEDLPDDLGRLHRKLRDRIPAGLGKAHHGSAGPRAEKALARLGLPPGSRAGLPTRQLEKIREQFGTLGSGNHFLEVSLDERGRVWVVLHSGSRGIGKELAERHIRTARLIAERERIELEDRDLAWLEEGRPEFDAYIADMLWAQDYAAQNREQMMTAALETLREVVGKDFEVQRVNCHHNYAARERHLDKDVWVTRKGAIRARRGELGVVPGSMAASTYIVRGLGNPRSYESCAHGAGRRLGRNEARRSLSASSLAERMRGRAWDVDLARRLVDEHPDAYKDVNQVMEAQRDLVEVVHELHQVLNMKGT